MLNLNKVLLIVDMQIDFCPGGALPVPGGDEIIPMIHKYIEIFRERSYSVFASRDWHQERTEHFKSEGGRWPKHCIRGTYGAGFHPALELPDDISVISKGTGNSGDGYSVFSGKGIDGRSFNEMLQEKDTDELYIAGLATEFCVKETALDAQREGYAVFLLKDATRGIDPEQTEKAVEEMVDNNIHITDLEETSERI